jgi:putative transposase
MPVHRQKKDTTPNTSGSTPEQTAPALPEQRAFHQYLRELARGAIRVVLESVMREELDALIGVGWGESSPRRKGYRNGSYTRDLVTTSGRIEDLQVPRDREGLFHTQVFERYRRYEPQVAQGLTEMFVAGTSTHKVGKVAATLMGMARSRQCHQSAQPRSGAAIHHLARTPTTRALAYPLSGRDSFQRASRR